MNTDFKEKLYEWIKKRASHPESEIDIYDTMEDHFPSGPGKPIDKLVHIVVLTPESECGRGHFSRFN